MTSDRFDVPVRFESTGEAIIRMRAITKTFQSAAGEATVLKDIDLDVLQGQFVSVVGRSGSGKSTLVNMITGIDRPSSGTVEIGSLPILTMHESEMAVWRGKNLGIVFQFFQLLPMLTLIENVMLPMDFCNMYSPASRETRARGLLRRVGVEELAYALPGAIAGGQQQCVAVARALANDPPILIADEPTGNLDSHTAEQVMAIFEELASLGKTILIVTHDRTLAQRTNRRLLITDGELVNETLAAAFPDAPHTQLLQLSKQAVAVILPAGSSLADAPGERVYLVTRGEMAYEVHGEKVRLTSGCLLDPLSIRHEAVAGEQGAELLALPPDMALPLLSGPGQAPARRPERTKDGTRGRNWLRRIWRVK